MKLWWGLLALAILVAACSGTPDVICNDPYMLKGTDCCLDSDGDNICDTDKPVQQECPELDCSLCEAEVVTRDVTTTVTKFVCANNGATVDDPDDCFSSAHSAFADYEPITTNENGTVIEDFSIRPACRDGFHAVEFHWTLGSTAQASEIQIRDNLESDWETVYTYSESAIDKYVYGVFCNGKCTAATDIYFEPDKSYLVRMRFDYDRLYGEYQYSNEHIMDATIDGEFTSKLC